MPLSAMGGVAAASAPWPLIVSLNPCEDVAAAWVPVDFKLAVLQLPIRNSSCGEADPHLYCGGPLTSCGCFGTNGRPASPVIRARLLASQPPYAKKLTAPDRTGISLDRSAFSRISVAFPDLKHRLAGASGSNLPGGTVCPCHGSNYDLAGCVFSGVPASYNLPVPPYHFVSKTVNR